MEPLDVIPKIINHDDNETLIKPFTSQEVEAMKTMHLDKSSSLDGFSDAFYKFSWDIIKMILWMLSPFLHNQTTILAVESHVFCVDPKGILSYLSFEL